VRPISKNKSDLVTQHVAILEVEVGGSRSEAGPGKSGDIIYKITKAKGLEA
jgi:hypothetical protein